MRIGFAGDRQIAVDVLRYLSDVHIAPEALMVSSHDRASHADELIALCPDLPPGHVVRGGEFRQPAGIALLRGLDLDLLVAIHFPYIVPPEVLSIPRLGVLNLHPAYLPYNRGWHTPSWAILEGTPAGATLHFMDEGLDTGDIVHRQELDVRPGDTADSLYQRVLALELEVFRAAWPRIMDGTYQRTTQDPGAGTVHSRNDLFRPEVQRIDLDRPVEAGELLRRLRALSTNRPEEAAYYEAGRTRYHIHLTITEQPMDDPQKAPEAGPAE